jgi:plasmid stabilization system protein ParE
VINDIPGFRVPVSRSPSLLDSQVGHHISQRSLVTTDVAIAQNWPSPSHYVFVESGSIDIANRVIESITVRFVLIEEHPRAGRVRDDLRPGVRSFPTHGFLLFYRIEGLFGIWEQRAGGSNPSAPTKSLSNSARLFPPFTTIAAR